MSPTKQVAEKRRCANSVWNGRSGFSPCSNNAKHEHLEKWYCGIHYPPNVDAKWKAKDAKWKAERVAILDERGRKERVSEAERAVIEAAEAWHRENQHGAPNPLHFAVEGLLKVRGDS